MGDSIQTEEFEAEQTLLTRDAVANVKTSTGLLGRLLFGFEAMFGLVVAWVALFVFRIRREYNTAATGHMIDAIDRVHAAGGFAHSGFDVAAAFESGVLRFVYFDNLATVPEAIVIAFSTTSAGMNTQQVMVTQTEAALKAIVATVENHQDWGVLRVVCEALGPLSPAVQDSATCQAQLCTSKGKGVGAAVQGALTTGIMGGFAAGAAAGPVGAIGGAIVGAIAGYLTTTQSQCQNALCNCGP